MLLITIASGAAPPNTNPPGKIALFPVQAPMPIPGTPPAAQPLPQLSLYVSPVGAGFPGPSYPAQGPAILLAPVKPNYA